MKHWGKIGLTVLLLMLLCVPASAADSVPEVTGVGHVGRSTWPLLPDEAFSMAVFTNPSTGILEYSFDVTGGTMPAGASFSTATGSFTLTNVAVSFDGKVTARNLVGWSSPYAVVFGTGTVETAVPIILGIGTSGVNSVTLSPDADMSVGTVVADPSTGVFEYKFEGTLPANVGFDTTTGYFTLLKVSTPFNGQVYARNTAGWSNGYSVSFVGGGEPTVKTDASMAVLKAGETTSYYTGDPVSVTWQISATYDINSLALSVTLPPSWVLSKDIVARTATLTGPMTASDFAFYFTATSTADSATWRSSDLRISSKGTKPVQEASDLATPGYGEDLTFATDEDVEIYFTIGSAYDLDSLLVFGTSSTNWTKTVDSATRMVTLTGKMPASNVGVYFTATKIADSTVYKSPTFAVTNYTPGKKDNGGGGGCDGGFGILAMLLASIFLRRKN